MGAAVAVKKLKGVDASTREAVTLQLRAEAMMLGFVRHPNIVTFYGVCMDSPEPLLLTELLEGGSLHERLYKDSGAFASWLRVVFLFVLSGMFIFVFVRALHSTTTSDTRTRARTRTHNTHTHTYTRARAHTHTLSHTHSHTHTHTHTHARARTHTHTITTTTHALTFSLTRTQSRYYVCSLSHRPCPPLYTVLLGRPDRPRLTHRQKRGIASDVGAGLTYLHGKEVAHLDLKPHNVMLTSAPCVAKLCDFGLTRVTRSSVFKIPKLRPGGTPLYMSPEQHSKQYEISPPPRRQSRSHGVACVRVRVRVHVRACVCVCARVCMLLPCNL
jgi:serine/threonine protein kinase